MADDDDGWKLPATPPRAQAGSAFGAGDAFGARRRRPSGRVVRGVGLLVVVAAVAIVGGVLASGGSSHRRRAAVVTPVKVQKVTVHKVAHAHTPAHATTLSETQFVDQANQICDGALPELESDAQDTSGAGEGLLSVDVESLQGQLRGLNAPSDDEGDLSFAIDALDTASVDDAATFQGDLQDFGDEMSLTGATECRG
jgi:hypothetical protein